MSSLAEHFSLEKECILHPVDYKTIMKYQHNNKNLVENARSNTNYSIKYFHWLDKTFYLICRRHKIVICKVLRKKVIEWYHNSLCQPEETCTELSIVQHFLDIRNNMESYLLRKQKATLVS